MRRALGTIVGEAEPAFFWPYLPERGFTSHPVGRMTAFLPDMVWGYGVRTFAMGPHESRFHRAALSELDEDSDLLEECVATQGVSKGPLVVPLAGPLSCLSQVELPNGHWMVTDPGAVRDMLEQYAEMLTQLEQDLIRRTGRTPLFVVDETAAGPVLSGDLSGVHRWEHIPPPDPQDLIPAWGRLGEHVTERVSLRLPMGVEEWLTYCAPLARPIEDGAAMGIAYSLPAAPTTTQRDLCGDLFEQWGSAFQMQVALPAEPRRWRSFAHRLAQLLRDVGVTPVKENLPTVHDAAVWAGEGSTSVLSEVQAQRKLALLVQLPELILDEWPQ